jgi:hypothetical protein
MAGFAVEALEVEDPWEAFAGFVRRCAELQAADLALSQVLQDQPALMCGAAAGKRELTEAAGRLVRRAQDAGVLRRDFQTADLAMVTCWGARPSGPGTRGWERMLALVLDGLRAEAARTPMPT